MAKSNFEREEFVWDCGSGGRVRHGGGDLEVGDQTKELRLQSSTTCRKQRQNRKWGEAIRSRSPSPSGLWSTSSCKAAFPRTSITSRNSATSWDEVLTCELVGDNTHPNHYSFLERINAFKSIFCYFQRQKTKKLDQQVILHSFY